MPATAFKPAYEAHGHTMITRGVLGLGGYSFGWADSQPLTVDRFRFRYSTSSGDQFVHAAAIDHILAGVQSRDWFYYGPAITDSMYFSAPFEPRDCRQSWIYAGVESAAEVYGILFQPSDGVASRTGICTSMDLKAEDGHFDNDNFVGSINSIRTHLRLAISYAKVWANSSDRSSTGAHSNRLASRVMLGKAIHTLQDFYAHSNWIEEFGVSAGIAEFLTDSAITGQPLSQASLDLLAAQSNRNSGQGAPFAQNLGGAVFAPACPSRLAASSDAWRLNDGNYLNPETVGRIGFVTTAAWWDALNGANGDRAPASDDRGTSRCDHGVSDDSVNVDGWVGKKEFSGIAKDLPGWPPNPWPRGEITGEGANLDESYQKKGAFIWSVLGTPIPDVAKTRAEYDATRLYKGAAYAAARHTKVLLERFAKELVTAETSSAIEADLVLSAVFGSDTPTKREIFVIDRSGTMAEILPTIVSGVGNLLRDGVDYVLVDFAGSNVSGGQTDIEVRRGDAISIRFRLSQLVARGGGGCHTPSWEAISAAVAASGMGGDLYLFTDASASDPARASDVIAQAQVKQIRLHHYVTGSCSPLDESYVDSAQNTGGTTNLVEHSDVALTQILSANHGNTDTLHVVHSQSSILNGSESILFPVESGVTRLKVVVTGSLTALTVLAPNGQPVDPGENRALNGWNVSIDNPAQGFWRLNLVGSGTYSATASVSSEISFDSAEKQSTVHLGRRGHEFRAPLARPAQNGRVWMKVHVSNGRSPLTLDLLSLDGTVLTSTELGRAAADYFEGEVTLPAVSHRFRVRGFAADGSAFARVFGQGNVAPSVAQPGSVVASFGASGIWRAGTVNAFAISLKNLGGDDMVSFAPGTLPSGATLTCNPSSISIPGSEQVNVLCSIFLPEAPDRTDFSVVVSSTTAVPAVAQTVTIPLAPLKLPLSCALDIDGDNRVDPAVDGVLLTRYLLGFRGASLTSGLTIPGPRKTDALLSAFFGNAAQFDLVGRASPAPTATVDGLLMTRLMLGFDDNALLNGINLPAGAQFTTAAAIKDNVVAKCAGGF